jgi:Zn-dependent protease
MGTPNPRDAQPGRSTRRAPAGLDQRSAIWVIAIVAVAAILVRTHRISVFDVIFFCTLIPSIILHEVAHGWVALAFGDDTAKRAGRLTLNPIAHIDPIGTIIVPAVLVISGVGFFGWAKPVPVNVGKLRSPRNQGVLVSLAGPATNVVLAAASLGVMHLFGGQGVVGTTGGVGFASTWVEIVFLVGVANIWLAIFNMIPVPPLDGSVLIERMMPRDWWPAYLRARQYALPLLLVLVVVSDLNHGGPLLWLSTHVFTWWGHMVGFYTVAG